MALSDLLALARDYARATGPGTPDSGGTRGTRGLLPTGPVPEGQKTKEIQSVKGRGTPGTRGTRDFDMFQGSEGRAQPAADPAGDQSDARPPEPPELPPPGSPERAVLDARQGEMVAGLLAASRIRPSPPAAPVGHPTDEAVEALAEALADRPCHGMADPAAAMRYYRADARRRLALLDDDLARGLLVGFWRHRGVQ